MISTSILSLSTPSTSTLTIYLSPVLWQETRDQFGVLDIDTRLLHGGLPESLLASNIDTAFFAEWIDSFYARDIQLLFGIRNRNGFLKLMELLLYQSGGLVDYTKLAKLSELSRPTIKSHIEAMQIAHAIYLVPPFHGGAKREIIRRPKCYTFDTGFISFIRGWDSVRDEDRGLLWEHLVLDVLRANELPNNIFYWQDKSSREIDFVIKRADQTVNTVECKINPDNYSVDALKVFRGHYPRGKNFLISPSIIEPYNKRYGDIIISCIPLKNILSLG